ncbi:DegT/DnrJ/EryC1/StrS aminotransferase family protein [Methanobacterium formicicum]|uniref:Pleiotropic regulatory protein n=1 Tax=Methanobacterium formicicum (strain DSM 3637 / PP1) TaxID=1204725 RepID=K2RUF7_METFP|nr:DegT/DnrJ/EryC1/StrS family aminotransferase [Methanobacterium formicicum]EKF86370.1 Pleiotropic regulatory protein [Methanobacterium formicicum DSM 3637]
MNVPLLDLKRQYQTIKSKIDYSIQEVIDSQSFILGDIVADFEDRISKYCGTKNAIGVASGTDALLLSLRAQDISKKVITSPFTFFATAGAIHNAGGITQFVDIDSETYNINPHEIEKTLKQNKDIEAIIPVHLFGLSSEMETIIELVEDNNLALIEDAAQAIGANYHGSKIGSMGTTCFSFFPSKNLGGFGDGGVITTNDDELADKIRTLRVHGSKPKYYHHVIGYNSRLDAIQAAILNVKLDYLDKWTDERIKNAKFYNKSLMNVEGLKIPYTPENQKHVFNQYTIRIGNSQRDALKQFLENKGVSTAIYYPLPLHLQPCFSPLNYKDGDFANSEKACQEVLSLPIFPELEKEEQKYVIDCILEFFDN